jgi:hypothetical protein
LTNAIEFMPNERLIRVLETAREGGEPRVYQAARIEGCLERWISEPPDVTRWTMMRGIHENHSFQDSNDVGKEGVQAAGRARL